MNEKEKLQKSIAEIQNRIVDYKRDDAIALIRRVRIEHPGEEQIVYVLNNTPLEKGSDIEIIETLRAEQVRLLFKLQE